jgi:hypothetical protein
VDGAEEAGALGVADAEGLAPGVPETGAEDDVGALGVPGADGLALGVPEAAGVLGVAGVLGALLGVDVGAEVGAEVGAAAGGEVGAVVVGNTAAGLGARTLPSWFTTVFRPAPTSGSGLKIGVVGAVGATQVKGFHRTGPLGAVLAAVLGAAAVALDDGALLGTVPGALLGAGVDGAEPTGTDGFDPAGMVGTEEGAEADGASAEDFEPLGCGRPGRLGEPAGPDGLCGSEAGADGSDVPGTAAPFRCTACWFAGEGVVPVGQAPVFVGAAFAIFGRITPLAISTAGSPAAAKSRARLLDSATGAASGAVTGASSVLAVAFKASSPQRCVLDRGQRRDGVLRRHGRRGEYGV